MCGSDPLLPTPAEAARERAMMAFSQKWLEQMIREKDEEQYRFLSHFQPGGVVRALEA